MMHGGERWRERARNDMTMVSDHRTEWTGPEAALSPNKTIGEWEKKALALLKQYMAIHGDWEEVTFHRPATGVQGEHSWRFTICECALCQAAEKLVGHPSTPNG